MVNKAIRKIISINIDLIDYNSAITKIVELAKERSSSYVCFANVHMVIEAKKDNCFSKRVNEATLVLADGIPLIKTLNFLYGQKQERVAGMDLFPDLLLASEINQLEVFFFGDTTEVLNKIQITAKKQYPNLNIVGSFSPPFGVPLDDDAYIKLINTSQANIVFVALGCPKQENWMARHSSKINGVLLGVGGAFPVYAGLIKRAPNWMQKWGLEWFYRLCQEPNRLFKRYLITNTVFLFSILRIRMDLMMRRND